MESPARLETIDYDEVEKLAVQEHPKMIIGGGSAYPRTIDFARHEGESPIKWARSFSSTWPTSPA